MKNNKQDKRVYGRVYKIENKFNINDILNIIEGDLRTYPGSRSSFSNWSSKVIPEDHSHRLRYTVLFEDKILEKSVSTVVEILNEVEVKVDNYIPLSSVQDAVVKEIGRILYNK